MRYFGLSEIQDGQIKFICTVHYTPFIKERHSGLHVPWRKEPTVMPLCPDLFVSFRYSFSHIATVYDVTRGSMFSLSTAPLKYYAPDTWHYWYSSQSHYAETVLSSSDAEVSFLNAECHAKEQL